MRYLKVIVFALIVAVFCVVSFQNQEVFIHQFKLQFNLGLIKSDPYLTRNVVLLLIAFFAGVIFSIIYGVLHTTSKKAELKSKDRRIKELEEQVSSLSAKVADTMITSEHSRTPDAPPAPFSSPTSMD